MRYSKALEKIKKYTGIEFKQADFVKILNISRAAISARVSRDSEFTIEELIEEGVVENDISDEDNLSAE